MTNRIIRIAARSSSLSKIQAYEIGSRLCSAHPGLEAAFHFRTSQGDRDRMASLVAFGGKGVFTEDLTALLLNEQADVVVHSWKDLPVEMHPETCLGASPERADMHDVLLLRGDVDVHAASALTILSSSPRRERNLSRFLPGALPKFTGTLSFVPVRGNVQTRIRKLREGQGHGLIVAKAALDRLLSTSHEEFAEDRRFVREALSECRFMVLPLRLNPCAPAQGALAVEVKKDREDLRGLLSAISCPETLECAERERGILASYGGGCHQKIGVAVLKRPYGRLTFIQGESPDGKDLESTMLERDGKLPPRVSRAKAWPLSIEDNGKRESLNVRQPGDKSLWVVKDSALPADWVIGNAQIVWASGIQTWRKLAARGIWVHGCAEGLGETESPSIDVLLGKKSEWVKLTHEQGQDFPWGSVLHTYRKHFDEPLPDLRTKTHFFWRSGQEFLRAVEQYPGIRNAYHASGPGSTCALLQKEIGDRNRLSVFLDYDHWLKEVVES